MQWPLHPIWPEVMTDAWEKVWRPGMKHSDKWMNDEWMLGMKHSDEWMMSECWGEAFWWMNDEWMLGWSILMNGWQGCWLNQHFSPFSQAILLFVWLLSMSNKHFTWKWTQGEKLNMVIFPQSLSDVHQAGEDHLSVSTTCGSRATWFREREVTESLQINSSWQQVCFIQAAVCSNSCYRKHYFSN